MNPTVETLGPGLRAPFWVVGSAVAVVWTLVLGGLSVLWYFLVVPLLWLVFVVPATFVSTLVSRSGGARRQLRSRLSHAVHGWRSNWRYHFAELFEIFGKLNRWLSRGTTRRY